MTLPYTNFIFDYMRSGLAADRPANPETTDNVNPDAITQYFAIDTKVLSTWSTQDSTWYDTAFTSLTAASISFDNGPSGMAAVNVQDAIDETFAAIPTDAAGILYDNSGSGLTSVNVQDAIDELVGGIGYTDERAQDAVGGILDNGTVGDVNFTYDDGTPKISGVVKNNAITFAKMQAITDGKLLGAQGGTAVEEISVGTGLSLAANTLSSSITQYTDELAQDAVGGMIDSGLVYDDATPKLSVVRVVQISVTDPNGDALTTGDGKAYFRVNSKLNGYNLVGVAAAVTTVSSSGIPTFQIANVTDAVDMLSTKLTIDANETDSSTAASAAVIDVTKDDVATADMLRIDCDVAGTGAKGVIVELTFSLP